MNTMKLLASDYDKTLYTNKRNLILNIDAINRFMKNGNKFAIVTGRSFLSIKQEIDCYNIKYDYLACNNGLIIFDNEDNIIDCSLLYMMDLYFIYESLNGNKDVQDIRLYSFKDSIYELNNILEVYAKFKNIKATIEYKKYVETKLSNIKCDNMRNKVFISNDRTKAYAVSFIQQLNNIDLKDVYTVGDNINDIDMLEKFKGYKMLLSNPNLWFKNLQTTRKVHTLIKKINK